MNLHCELGQNIFEHCHGKFPAEAWFVLLKVDVMLNRRTKSHDFVEHRFSCMH